MNYRIYFDETGDFSLKRKKTYETDYVAGWVSIDLTPAALNRIINNRIDSLNKKCLMEDSAFKSIRVPKDLHFMPLHSEKARKGSNLDMSIPLTLAPQVVHGVFNAITPYTHFIFRSQGFPFFYANEQGAYFEILRATILQVVDSIGYLPNDSIEISIASRRIRELLGEFGFNNWKEYENKFCQSVLNEINTVFSSRKINNPITVCVESASYEIPLAISDFICGAFRWKPESEYLNDFPTNKIRVFNINNAFSYMSKRAISQIKTTFKSDPAKGLFQALCYLTSESEDYEIKSITNSFIGKFQRRDYLSLASLIKSYLHEQILENPYRHQALRSMEKLLDVIQMHIHDYQIQAVVHFYKIKLAGHSGYVDLDMVGKYTEFLDYKGLKIFGSRYLVAQEKVEVILSSVQSAAFNRFDFEKVESYLMPEYKKYISNFQNISSGVDETLARLEGSIGQMYGFLCDYPGQADYYDEAINYIKRDIALCEYKSSRWKQAMGYLTTLYFKRGDLDKAIKSFLSETDSEKSKVSDIFDLSKINSFGTFADDFFQLHRMYICALAQKNNIQISGLAKFKERFLLQGRLDRYPRFLSGKWLSILFYFCNDTETAIPLIKQCLSSSEDAFTIRVIKIPLKILANFYENGQGVKTTYDLQSEIEELEAKVKCIHDNLSKLGVLSYATYSADMDPYEIASVMPFYYS